MARKKGVAQENFQPRKEKEISEEKLARLQPLKFSFLQKILQKNRLSHGLLFSGGKGVGKEKFAYYVACRKFCENLQQGLPCLSCNSCLRVLKTEHPDFHVIERMTQMIKVEQIRELIDTLTRKSTEGRGQVVVIKEAESMNRSSANSLLKTLEEPLGDTLILLLTQTPSKLLPTILSRVQEIALFPLLKELLTEELLKKGIAKTLAIDLLAIATTVDEAMALSKDEKFLSLRSDLQQFWKYITAFDAQSFIYVQKSLTKYWTGKELLDDEKKANQEIILAMLLHFARENVREKAEKKENLSLQQATNRVECITKMQQLKEANVPMQAILEQFAVSVLREDDL